MVKKGLKKYMFGQRYRPIDNSYSYCYETGDNHHLAGTNNTPHQIVEIISKPYTETMTYLIRDGFMRTYEVEFVDVRCERGLTHKVMYFERMVVK